MTPKELFVVGARIVGLVELAKALDYLVAAFDISTGLYKPSTFSIGAAYAHILVNLVVGIYLLSGARELVRVIFERPATKKFEESQAADEHKQV